MVEDFDTLCGITQEEMEYYFAEPIAELAQKYGQTVPGMMELLKRRYDGYHFSSRLVDVYNPFSILNVFRYKEMKDYWFSTLFVAAVVSFGQEHGRVGRRILQVQRVHGLQGDGREAVADDLPERLPDHQGV